MQKKKRVWCIIACILIGILGDVISLVNVLGKFPEYKLSADELFGKDYVNLKEFQVDEADILTAVSDDPWIAFYFDEPEQVHNLRINISSLGGDSHSAGEVYVLDTADSLKMDLYEGENTLEFPKEWTKQPISGVRLDLTDTSGVSIGVEQVVINDPMDIFWDLQPAVLVVVVACILLLAVFWAWSDYAAYKKDDRYWMVGAAAMGLQLGSYGIFGVEYFLGNIENIVLLWFLVFMTSLFLMECIMLRTSMARTGNEDSRSKGEVLERHAVMEIMVAVRERRHLPDWLKANLSAGCIILCAAVLNFSVIEILSGVPFDLVSQANMWRNLMIYLEVVLVIYLLVRRIGIALIISNLLAFILGLVNYYYFQFRGEPFELIDAIMTDTAMTVIQNYAFEMNDIVWFVLMGEICFFVFVIAVACMNKLNFTKKARIGLTVFGVLMFALIWAILPSFSYWNITETSRNYGYLYSFLGYVKDLGGAQEPEGYTAQKVDDLLQKYDSDEAEKSPNIIVIMNEAFADLPQIYGFETDQDTLPFIHSLKENTITGDLLVSVFGGTTCNSEYEFLTGNSMAFLPGGSVPFMQYIQSEQQSAASILKKQDYRTIGYHPYGAKGFHRDMVYPLLGFDSFYAIEDDLPSKNIFRYFLSDRSDFENVIHLYEESKKKADSSFIFNVTIQNHGGYSQDTPVLNITSQPLEEELRTTQLQEYLSLIKESDDAFRKLVEYFSSVEEDTIICMFGDHQPGLGTDSYVRMEPLLYNENVTLADKQKQYMTSFVIWANYDIEEDERVLLSANYLRPYLFRAAGAHLSNYDRFLLDVQKEYPAVNAFGYCDQKGRWHEINTEKEKLLRQYSWVVYNNVFDKNHMKQQYFE